MTTQQTYTPLSKLLDLSGKAAIVTGGGMGIGYGIAMRLSEAGAAQAMAGANPNIRWVEVPRADHYVHEDNAPFVNAQIEQFLTGLK